LVSSLILGPLWIMQVYQKENTYQKNQIFIDNAAIMLGQKDRDLMNQVEKENRKLKSLHELYHSAIACSFIPALSASCQTSAQNLNKAILLLGQTSTLQHGLLWRGSHQKMAGYLTLNEIRFDLKRHPVPPLTKAHCVTCGLINGWQIQEDFLRAEISSKWNSEIEVKVGPMKTNFGNWSYRLWSQ
ncbi:MAG: hypothetical protein EBZ49_18845, partial [Proteobacteria bacterium]|nr:hypothetical protein [Pseudomonadota bacterium]